MSRFNVIILVVGDPHLKHTNLKMSIDFLKWIESLVGIHKPDLVVNLGDTIAGGTAQVGHKVRVKVRKNRMGIPARVAQFTFHYEKGITDIGGEIFELAKSLNIIGKKDGAGNAIYFGEIKLGRGLEDAKTTVSNDRDLQGDIMDVCYNHKDSPIETDASGFVEDKEDYSSIEV